jgi:hypothetical protein
MQQKIVGRRKDGRGVGWKEDGMKRWRMEGLAGAGAAG